MKNIVLFIISILTVFSLLVSCEKGHRKNEQISNEGFSTIKLTPKKVGKNSFNSSTFVDSVQYIPLETNDSVIIGRIGKIVVWKDFFYVLDNLSETIFCFEHTGKFKFRISKKGFGPKEYYSITDFNITSLGEIWIYSASQGFLVYSSEGVFIKKIPSKILCMGFGLEGNDTIDYYVGVLPNKQLFQEYPQQYALLQFYNDKMINQFIPYRYYDELRNIATPNKPFITFNDSISFVDYYENKIYRLDSGQLIPRYKIILMNNNYSLSLQNTKKENDDLLQHNSLLKIFSINETNELIWISYVFNDRIYCSIYQKGSNFLYNIGTNLIDDNNVFLNLPLSPIASFGNYFISIIEPNDFKHAIFDTSSQHLKALKLKLKDTDNPVIIKINTKKRWE